MRYDPATATFEDDGGPSFNPKPLPKGSDWEWLQQHRMSDDGNTLELVDRFAQVQGD